MCHIRGSTEHTGVQKNHLITQRVQGSFPVEASSALRPKEHTELAKNREGTACAEAWNPDSKAYLRNHESFFTPCWSIECKYTALQSECLKSSVVSMSQGQLGAMEDL